MITPIILEECLAMLAEAYIPPASSMSQHLRLSIAHHLKDARRWQYVKHNNTQGIGAFSPEQFERWVDGELKR